MNSEKVQQIINEVISQFRATLHPRQINRQYAPAKHQIATLTELGILDLMPSDFGHGDAKAVIEAAQNAGGKFQGTAGHDDWTTSNAHPLYVALNEVEEEFVPIPTYTRPRNSELAALIREREIIREEIACGKATNDTYHALYETSFKIKKLGGS